MLHSSCSMKASMALALLGCICSVEAQAHAKLVSADPAPNATVSAPQVIRLEFSEEIAKSFSMFRVARADGSPVRLAAAAGGDAKSLAAAPSARLTAGVYTVSWTAVATDDGHKTSGRYHFTVR